MKKIPDPSPPRALRQVGDILSRADARISTPDLLPKRISVRLLCASSSFPVVRLKGKKPRQFYDREPEPSSVKHVLTSKMDNGPSDSSKKRLSSPSEPAAFSAEDYLWRGVMLCACNGRRKCKEWRGMFEAAEFEREGRDNPPAIDRHQFDNSLASPRRR